MLWRWLLIAEFFLNGFNIGYKYLILAFKQHTLLLTRFHHSLNQKHDQTVDIH